MNKGFHSICVMFPGLENALPNPYKYHVSIITGYALLRSITTCKCGKKKNAN